MNVRFRLEYAETTNGRLSYELVSDEPEMFYLDHKDGRVPEYQEFYNTKLLGYIPSYKMEPSEDTDTPAIDVFVKLSNL